MHLPDKHVLPVSHSLLALTLQVKLHTLRAAAMAVATCMLHILLAHCEAEVHTAPIAKLVVAAMPVEAVKVPIEVLTAGRDIAFPVGKAMRTPEEEDNVLVMLATTAAHCPILAEPVITMLPQLLLLH